MNPLMHRFIVLLLTSMIVVDHAFAAWRAWTLNKRLKHRPENGAVGAA